MISIFRINDIIDLPVFDCVSEEKRCTVRDVIIDTKENRLHILICRERMLGRSLEAIPYKNVESISQNGIRASGNISRMSPRGLLAKQRRFSSCQDILGKLVQSTRGEPLGIIRDILFDTNTGIIKAYELSEGYFDDFIRGRHIVELEHGYTLTGSNAVIKENTAKGMLKTQ